MIALNRLPKTGIKAFPLIHAVRFRITQSLPLISLGALAALLWIPFRFDMGFVGDDWYFYLYAKSEPFMMLPARPLIAWPHNIAYWLAPGTFFGFNLLLCFVTFVRGALSYVIFRQLGFNKAFAFSIAALALMFPADQGAYYIGALTVYFSSAFFLGSLYLLIRQLQQPVLRNALGIWILHILCLGMYEASYPLILFSPVLVFVLPVRINRSFWKTLGVWYCIPILNLVRYAFIILFKSAALGYQAGITRLDGIDNMLSSLFNIYAQHFLGGWLSTADFQVAPFLPYVLAAGLISFAIFLWLSKRSDFSQPISRNLPRKYQNFVLAGVGICIILLSIAVYLPTSARDVHVRTYYMSVVGAALTVIVLLKLIAGRRIPFALCFSILTMLGCLRLLEQGSAFLQDSERQQQLVLSTLSVVPNLPPFNGIVIIDETSSHEWAQTFHSNWQMQYPFILAYEQPALVVAVCPPEEAAVESMCSYEPEFLRVSPDDNPEWALPYSQLVFLRYQEANSPTRVDTLPNHPEYNPQAIIDRTSPPPEQVYIMFGEPVPESQR